MSRVVYERLADTSTHRYVVEWFTGTEWRRQVGRGYRTQFFARGMVATWNSDGRDARVIDTHATEPRA